MNQNDAVRQLVGEIVPQVRELMIKAAHASWEQNTSGTPEAAQKAAALNQELRTYYSDPARLARIKELRDLGGASDPVLNRQLDILYRAHLTNQISSEEIREVVERETELSQMFNNFRATYQGQPVSDNDLKSVLRQENDNAKRREAWLASKQIGAQAAEKVRELARVRNRIARKLGFRDYFALALETQEIDEAELLAALDDLREASDKAYRYEKKTLDAELAERFGVRPDEIMPWHYADPFFQDAPPGKGGPDLDRYFANLDVAAVSVGFYDRFGLEVRDILSRSDLYERPGKMQHAFSLNLDREGDIRILCNLKPTQSWMTTQLHELGHATYDQYIDREIPWLLRRPAHTMTTEAIAQLMGRLTNNARWLSGFAQVPEQEAQQAESFLHRQERRDQLIFSRWGMVVTHFERALYGDPEQDLGKLWWELVNRLQLVPKPEGDRSTDWASKIHIANYPVYYHNYVLGELTASQLQANLTRDLGPDWMLSAEGGLWLKERLFRGGNLLAWNERLAAATGERLNARYYVEQFA